jgi:YVTN family beta-propeller protein
MKRLLCFVLAASAAFAAEGYHVIQKIHIGGSGNWDTVTLDESARRLYVANDTRTIVLDIDAGKVVGEIPDTLGVHGIAIASELGRGFTSNGRSKNVTIFDLKTLKPLGQVAAGVDPNSIIFEPKTGRVFAFNAGSNDVTVIDAKTGEAAGSIRLSGKPMASVVDGSGKVWFTMQTTTEDWNILNEVGVIDAEKLTVLRQNSISPCDGPNGLAMDVKNRRLFSVCSSSHMAVNDADSGDKVASVAVGAGAGGAGFDAAAGLAFSSNGGAGTLTVVKENGGKYEPVETATTMRGARSMTIDPKTHNIYLPTAEYGPAAGAPIVPDSFMVLVVGK